MGSPAIFSGIFTKFLKSNLNLNNTVYWLTGTADPTSVAQNGPAGSIYSNTSTGKIYKKTDAGSSTNWTELTGSTGTGPRSYIILSAAPGYGSTNTKIRYYTNQATTGSDLTLTTNNSTSGTSITVNSDGIYTLTRNDGSGGAPRMGWSLNSSTLTTSISSLTAAEVIHQTSAPSTDIGTISFTGFFASGSVIRPHDDGNCNRSDARESRFIIIKVSN